MFFEASVRTRSLLGFRRFRVERAERAHELPELDDTVPLQVKEVEHPVRKEIRSFAGPEQGELEFFLHQDTLRRERTPLLL
jgi:hypothetical protein